MAGRTFAQALEAAPDNPRANLGMGRSYMAGKKSRIIVFQALERFFRKDNLSQAISYMKKAVELAPEMWEAHYWLGNAYMRLLSPIRDTACAASYQPRL